MISVADSHACEGAWTSSSVKGCSKEVLIGSGAWVARNQRCVVSSHDALVVFLVVAFIARHMAELEWSPLNVVDIKAGGSNCGSSIGWRERTVSWVEVVVVLGEHHVGFDGVDFVRVNTVSTGWLGQIGTVSVWSAKNQTQEDSTTHRYLEFLPG